MTWTKNQNTIKNIPLIGRVNPQDVWSPNIESETPMKPSQHCRPLGRFAVAGRPRWSRSSKRHPLCQPSASWSKCCRSDESPAHDRNHRKLINFQNWILMYTFSWLKEGFLYLLTYVYICPIKKYGSRTPEDVKNGGTHCAATNPNWLRLDLADGYTKCGKSSQRCKHKQRNHQSTNNVPSNTTIFYYIIPNTICFIYLCCIPLTFVLPCFTGKITQQCWWICHHLPKFLDEDEVSQESESKRNQRTWFHTKKHPKTKHVVRRPDSDPFPPDKNTSSRSFSCAASARSLRRDSHHEAADIFLLKNLRFFVGDVKHIRNYVLFRENRIAEPSKLGCLIHFFHWAQRLHQ